MRKRTRNYHVLFGNQCMDKRTKLYRMINGIKKEERPIKKPATEGQLDQRKRFAVVGKAIAVFRDTLTIGYQYQRPVKDWAGKLFSFIYKQLLIGEYQDYAIDYSRIVLSKGREYVFEDLTIDIPSNKVAIVEWQVFDHHVVLPLDKMAKVIVLVLNETKNEKFSITNLTYPKDGTRLEFSVDNYTLGDVIHCWMFLQSPGLKQVSATAYCTLGG